MTAYNRVVVFQQTLVTLAHTLYNTQLKEGHNAKYGFLYDYDKKNFIIMSLSSWVYNPTRVLQIVHPSQESRFQKENNIWEGGMGRGATILPRVVIRKTLKILREQILCLLTSWDYNPTTVGLFSEKPSKPSCQTKRAGFSCHQVFVKKRVPPQIIITRAVINMYVSYMRQLHLFTEVVHA